MTSRRTTPQLEQIIATHLAEWDSAHVELAVYGTDAPSTIAAAIGAFCERHLHASVDSALFYQSSIGAVAGLELDDGLEVVLKAHQPGVSKGYLEEMVRLRSAIARPAGLSPEVLVGPLPLGHGFAVVERFDDAGTVRDAHAPEVRRAMASSLREMVAALSPFVAMSPLPLHDGPSEGALWPTPHSKLFDFGATRAGAEYIDRVASAARDAMVPAGPVVIGHSDFRSEQVRFQGDWPVVAYDWDSLRKEREPSLVGSVAHAFCADWTRAEHAQAPTLEEARVFVEEYEEARGQPFSSDERRLCGAGFAYAVAYTARCGHALGRDERDEPGTFQHLIARHGVELLDL